MTVNGAAETGEAPRGGRLLRRAGTGLALALVAGLLALLVWNVVHKQEAQGFLDQIAAGDRPVAPGFRLRPLGGGAPQTLASLRGRPVLVNFWASWCTPCKAEAPLLEQAYREYGSRVAFVGIDANDFASDGRRFVARHGLGFRILEDGSGSTLGRWGVTGFPETFFVDARGRAVYHIGRQIKDAAELRAGIEAALR